MNNIVYNVRRKRFNIKVTGVTDTIRSSLVISDECNGFKL